VETRKPAPRLRSGRARCERKLRLELLGGDFPLTLLGEDAVNFVTNLGKVFHVQGGVVQPRSGKWPRGPVCRRVFFSETQTQDIFHDTLEPNPGEAREPGAKFGVKECYRVDPGFTKAGKILVSCMNNPFEV
jgi:hypothetical protein